MMTIVILRRRLSHNKNLVIPSALGPINSNFTIHN